MSDPWETVEMLILHEAGISNPDLAAAFGVSQQTVANVLSGKSWGWVGVRR